MPLTAASTATLSRVSRFFRHDNHLLWFSIIAVVGVAIYLVMSYATTDKHQQTTAAIRRRSLLGTDADTDADTNRLAGDDRENDGLLENDVEAQEGSRPSRRVRFKKPPTDAETTYATDAPPAMVNAQHSGTSSHPTSTLPTSSTIPLYVYLDIAKQDFLKSPLIGRVVIRLLPEHAPRTANNFAQLCADKKYVNIPFHRVVKDFMIQGGDLVNQDGTGTYSVYGGEGSTFDDEGFELAHTEAGLLSMANSGPNTNGSQFFILTQPAPHLDGKHVVFGKVIQGMEFVHDVEREVTDPNDRPIRKCYVLNCGVIEKEGIMQGHKPAQQPAQQQAQHLSYTSSSSSSSFVPSHASAPMGTASMGSSSRGGIDSASMRGSPMGSASMGGEPSPFSL